MVHIERTPLTSIARAEIYENTRKLPLSQIVAEEQPDIAMTAVFYNPKTWKPLCPVKSGGKVLYADSQYNYWAISWDKGADATPELVLPGGVSKKANYVANCTLVTGGVPHKTLYYGDDVGGARGRIGIGLTYGNELLVYGSTDGSKDAMTPEDLRDYMAKQSCHFAIMMDGGRKVNLYIRHAGVMMERKDPSQTLILIWLKKEGKHMGEIIRKVCLDAGHSASNKYNKSPDGTYYEHEFALDMAKRMKAVLERAGVAVVESRPDTGEVSLGERCKRSNEVGVDLFISLHSNATGTLSTGKDGWGSARGWEAYVYGLSGERYKAAKAILSRVEGVCPAIRKTPILAKPDLYVLANTRAPAVLIEHGFHTSREDVELLKDAAYRQKLAQAEAYGILDYLGIPIPEISEEKSEAELAVEWITGAGIMKGDVNGDLMLDQPVTRRQYAVMRYREAMLEGNV